MLTPVVGAIAAQQSNATNRIATGIPSGATVLPDLKALDQHIGDTRTAQLNPTMRVVAQMQGTSTQYIAVSAYEGCAGTITGANVAVQTPLMTSVMSDDFGRPVAGAPKTGQDLYGTQSTPGNLIVTGTKNTGKVAFLSGLFAGDGAAVDPYGTFSFTDPITGKSYNAHTKPDSVQQQPRIRAVIGDGLKFGAASGQPNVGKPIMVDLANQMGLQFVDDGNGGKAVATLADQTSIGYDSTGALTSLLGAGGNGSQHIKAGDGIFFSPGMPPSDPPTLTPATGSGLVAGQSYDYAYAYTTAIGATSLSPVVSVTPTGTTRQVSVGIPAAPTGAAGTGIVLVRRPSPQSGQAPSSWKTVTSYATDITATSSYTDSTPSTGLGAAFTDSPTSIGVLQYATVAAPSSGGPSAAAALHGYPKNVYNLSALKFITLADGRIALGVNWDPSTLALDSQGRLSVIGGGTGAATQKTYEVYTASTPSGTTTYSVPTTPTTIYGVSFAAWMAASTSTALAQGKFAVYLQQHGTSNRIALAYGALADGTTTAAWPVSQDAPSFTTPMDVTSFLGASSADLVIVSDCLPAGWSVTLYYS